MKAFIAGCLMLAATSVAAEIKFSFRESAPKDSFSITNEASCATGQLEVIIDLSTSAGNLVFDTTDAGAGVEVYQPFELTAGAEHVLSVAPVTDGDNLVQMTLSDMAPGAQVVFTIDVDDQLEDGALGQIRVAGSEIEGAVATVIKKSTGAISGTYNQRSQATLGYDACL